MHLNRFGITNSLASKSFDTSTQSKVFPLNALSVRLADSMRLLGQKFTVTSQGVGIVTPYVKWFQQFPQFLENRLYASAEREGYDFPGGMVDSKPQPTLILFLPDETPHLVQLRLFHMAVRDYLNYDTLSVRMVVQIADIYR